MRHIREIKMRDGSIYYLSIDIYDKLVIFKKNNDDLHPKPMLTRKFDPSCSKVHRNSQLHCVENQNGKMEIFWVDPDLHLCHGKYNVESNDFIYATISEDVKVCESCSFSLIVYGDNAILKIYFLDGLGHIKSYEFNATNQINWKVNSSLQATTAKKNSQLSVIELNKNIHIFYICPNSSLMVLELNQSVSLSKLTNDHALPNFSTQLYVVPNQLGELAIYWITNNGQLKQSIYQSHSLKKSEIILTNNDQDIINVSILQRTNFNTSNKNHILILRECLIGLNSDNVFQELETPYKEKVKLALEIIDKYNTIFDRAQCEESILRIMKQLKYGMKQYLGKKRRLLHIYSMIKKITSLIIPPKINKFVLKKSDIYTEQQKRFEQYCLHTIPRQRKLLDDLLASIKEYAFKEYQTSTIFISYAWPSEEVPEERDTQEFVSYLAADIYNAGLTVYLDMNDSGTGKNLQGFMKKISECDYTIVICNKTMEFKFKKAVSGVSVEYLNYVAELRKRPTHRVIPITLTADEIETMPGIVGMFAPESIYKFGYAEVLQRIIERFYKIGRFNPEYNILWQDFKLRLQELTKTRFINFPKCNANIISRPHLIQRLQSYLPELRAPTSKDHTLIEVSGMGGMGKTTLVYDFAQHHTKYEIIVWLEAKNRGSLCESYNQIAKELKLTLPQSSDDISSIIAFIEQHHSCLTIVDNIENFEDMEDLLPQKAGHMIVISRQRRNAFNTKRLEIKEMESHEACDLLAKLTDRNSDEIWPIANELKLYPLAIMYAAAYIHMQPEMSLKDVLVNLKSPQRLELLSSDNNAMGQINHESVNKTLQISLDSISRLPNSEKLLEFLNIASFFQPNNIPFIIMKKWLNNDALFSYIISTLGKFYFISIAYDQNNFSIHPLLHEFLRESYFREKVEDMLITAFNSLCTVWEEVDIKKPQTFSTGHATYLHFTMILRHLRLQKNCIQKCSSRILKILPHLIRFLNRIVCQHHLAIEMLDFKLEIEKSLNSDLTETYCLFCKVMRDLGDPNLGVVYLQKIELFQTSGWDSKDITRKLQQFKQLAVHDIFDVERARHLFSNTDKQLASIEIIRLLEYYLAVPETLDEDVLIKFYYTLIGLLHMNKNFIAAIKYTNIVMMGHKEIFNEQMYAIPDTILWLYNETLHTNLTLDYLLKKLNVNVKYFGENHPSTIRLYVTMGWVYTGIAKSYFNLFKDTAVVNLSEIVSIAESWFLKAKSILQTSPQNTWWKISLESIYDLHFQMGDYQKAYQCAKEALITLQEISELCRGDNYKEWENTFIQLRNKAATYLFVRKSCEGTDTQTPLLREEYNTFITFSSPTSLALSQNQRSGNETSERARASTP